MQGSDLHFEKITLIQFIRARTSIYGMHVAKKLKIKKDALSKYV
jgi:hypothetical protein